MSSDTQVGFFVTERMYRDLEWTNNKFQLLYRTAQAAGAEDKLKLLNPIMEEWWKFYRETYDSYWVPWDTSAKIRSWDLKAEELRNEWGRAGIDVEPIPGGAPRPKDFSDLLRILKWGAIATAVGTVSYYGIKIYADLRNTLARKPQTAGFGYSCARRSGKLTYEARKRMPASAYGLPEKRKYPMPDVSHAINAKARASAAYRRGFLSKREYDQVNRKANRIIKACRGRV